jgi:hypothetical protein
MAEQKMGYSDSSAMAYRRSLKRDYQFRERERRGAGARVVGIEKRCVYSIWELIGTRCDRVLSRPGTLFLL